MRIWGHPIHPMLVHFPVVFWSVAAAAYMAAAAGVADAAVLAGLSNGAGLVMAMLAMVAGVMELRRIDNGSDAMRTAIWHMMAMATAWTVFLIALAVSLPAAANLDRATVRLAGAACACVGFVLMGVGGWLGGRLVYQFGVGVAAGSRADAAGKTSTAN